MLDLREMLLKRDIASNPEKYKECYNKLLNLYDMDCAWKIYNGESNE